MPAARRLPQRPQRNIPDNRYVRAVRDLVTERAAIRANTRSRSATVMIAGHTAAPITSPRCSRNPAMRPEDNDHGGLRGAHGDLCSDWPQPAHAGGSYRIEITGEPSYGVDVCLSSRHGDHNYAGLVATAMRVVNTIPAVVAAPAGIRITLDLPLVTGRGLYAAG